MRYFLKELWTKINDCDDIVRTQAEKEWQENSALYQYRFEQTKKKLPSCFVAEYVKRKGFHDYIIEEIALKKKRKTYLCILKLADGSETILITMTDVKILQMDVNFLQNCMQGKMTWGYSEIEIAPSNDINLAVLCDMQNELQFTFKSIKIQQLSP